MPHVTSAEPPRVSVANAPRSRSRSRYGPALGLLFAALGIVSIVGAPVVRGETSETAIPQAPAEYAVSIRAETASRWTQGSYDVWRFRGNVRLEQGAVRYSAQDAVVKVLRGDSSEGEAHLLLVYLEEGVEIVFPGGHRSVGEESKPTYNRLIESSWLGRLRTYEELDLSVLRMEEAPESRPDIYQRMEAQLDETYRQVEPAQALEPFVPAGTAGSELPPGAGELPDRAGPQFTEVPGAANAMAGIRRVHVGPRSEGVRIQVQSRPSDDGTEQITYFPSGIRVTVEGTPARGAAFVSDKLVIESDRLIIWTRAGEAEPFGGIAELNADSPIEFYMEGNVVFREGDRIIYADRMYYDVRSRKGAVLSAEMLTPAPEFQGLVRLKAEVLEQLDEQRIVARNAAITSSRLGYPNYWVQGETIAFTDIASPVVDPASAAPLVDPATGEPLVDHTYVAESANNFVYVGGIPVLYYPTLRTNLDEPTFYVESIRFESDSVFGTGAQIELNAWQVLGISEPPIDADWDISVDPLSERGVGLGTDIEYEGYGLLGHPGPFYGKFDAWGIYDFGEDNLGFGRRDLTPDTRLRGRVRGQHRQDLGSGYQFTGELGFISDGNFLEQYFEREFDEDKDAQTAVELKRYLDTSSWRIAANIRTYDFVTQQEELPRFDHFVVGQSVLFDRLTWYGHTHAGYYRLRTAEPPSQNPEDLAVFQPLAWEIPNDGVRAGTRQELNLPLDAGPFRLTPFVLGDATFYSNDVNGEDDVRLLGQTGVRGSIPFWTVDRAVQSELLNLNGLAYKILLDGEFLYADASTDYTDLPLYDPLDDDSQEFFRRRFNFTTFNNSPGEFIPFRFDERSFAYRSGVQRYVAGPTQDIADDALMGRVAVRQKWQTKRGFPGQEQIVDWVTFDVEGTVFGNPDRDNFGEEVGNLNYDFRWAVGDRFTIFSDGYADTFDQGLRTASLGGQLTRPEQGSLFVGFRSIDGPFEAYVASSALSYRMSEKWIATAGVAYDFGPTGSIGQSVGFTRIGESFLVRLGLDVDVSRANVGFSLAIEPRFLPRSRLGNVGGVQIPALGERGLE